MAIFASGASASRQWRFESSVRTTTLRARKNNLAQIRACPMQTMPMAAWPNSFMRMLCFEESAKLDISMTLRPRTFCLH
ncbi:hypothetical protein [Rhizobium sp. FKL33]|uniref:hypothetical protein n=1 Tax=Rhizobium sp. FKL33 TaxID=2562307 RepID=UPI0010C0890E|nr:hypothetical protein [Rhizobium sp. FKL33]